MIQEHWANTVIFIGIFSQCIATVIRSFKVLLGGVMINSRCMADCYPPVTVGGGGLGYFKSS